MTQIFGRGALPRRCAAALSTSLLVAVAASSALADEPSPARPASPAPAPAPAPPSADAPATSSPSTPNASGQELFPDPPSDASAPIVTEVDVSELGPRRKIKRRTKRSFDGGQWGSEGPYDSASPGEEVRIPYRDGDPIPEGMRVDSKPRMGLVAAGITMTGALWTVSTIAAIALDKEGTTDDGDPNFDDMYWPMFIPVAGPFVTIGTADSSGTGAAILALDGVVQTAGLAMVIAGLAAPKLSLVPQRLNVSPKTSAAGIDISGSF